MNSEVSTARARWSALSRCVKNGERKPSDPDVVTAKTNLVAANIAAYVEKQLAQAPPLGSDQCDRIAALLRAGGAA